MGSQIAGIAEVGKPTPDSADVLNSWKEIAHYLGRGVRTVQRWEAQLALPVRRPQGAKRSAVIAMRSEIDDWLNSSPGPVSEWNGSTRSRSGSRGALTLSRLSPQVRADLSRFQLAFRKNMDGFIRVEVETGCTFAFLALNARDATRRAKNLTAALKAYRTAYHSLVKYDVSRDLRSEIVDRLADLRDLLDHGRASTSGWTAVVEIVESRTSPRRARPSAARE